MRWKVKKYITQIRCQGLSAAKHDVLAPVVYACVFSCSIDYWRLIFETSAPGLPGHHLWEGVIVDCHCWAMGLNEDQQAGSDLFCCYSRISEFECEFYCGGRAKSEKRSCRRSLPDKVFMIQCWNLTTAYVSLSSAESKGFPNPRIPITVPRNTKGRQGDYLQKNAAPLVKQ